MPQKVAYFDYAATTPTDDRVVAAMQPYWGAGGMFGNPASAQHEYGIAAAEAVEGARRHLARLVGAKPTEIVWTSGATEADNLALRGPLAASKKPMKLVTIATEHDAVRITAVSLRKAGTETVILPVGRSGLVDLNRVSEAVKGDRALVSVMLVNNETGVIQPIDEIAAICRQAGALLHVDAAQALARVPIDLKRTQADLMSFSAHKAYGPKGVGALFIRKGVKALPMQTGGGQERNLRSGTLPAPLIVGAGKACEILKKELPKHAPAIAATGESINRIIRSLSGEVIGASDSKVPHIVNVRFPGTRRNPVQSMSRVAVANASACSTHREVASHVLTAMGLSKQEAMSSLRISFSYRTTAPEVRLLKEELMRVVGKRSGKRQTRRS